MGVGQEFNENVDKSYVTDLGSPGIRKTGDLITLDYNEVLYYEQPYATKTESVTPFLVRYWEGVITLNPPIDSWVEEDYRTVVNLIETTTETILPDENITVIEDVINDDRISQDEANAQFGVDGSIWIDTVRNILSGVTSIAGVPVVLDRGVSSGSLINGRGTRGGEIGFVSGTNTLHLEVNFGDFTQKIEILLVS